MRDYRIFQYRKSEACLDHLYLFPSCRVKTVQSHIVGDGVAHASLIFHQEAYNTLLENWYDKLLYPRLQLAV